MSTPTAPEPAKLIASLIFSEDQAEPQLSKILAGAIASMEELYGALDYAGPISEFRQTKYYNKEMGQCLFRQFIGFSKLVKRESLADIKLASNRIEKNFSRPDGRRRINIDPGLLSAENLVLATGKNFTHRIYLRDGIFAEVTLLYQEGCFQSMPWTYWDYIAPDVLQMFEGMRKGLLAKLKSREKNC